MKPLTIAYLTARKEPKIEWFLDSLINQLKPGDFNNGGVHILIIDFHCKEPHKEVRVIEHGDSGTSLFSITYIPPKPTVWQGEHRLTKDQWWAKSAYINTAICVAKTEWISFLDDRCVLLPGYLDSIKEAMNGNYAVCGAYEKRHNMKVENGIIVEAGTVTGVDPRASDRIGLANAPGQWMFGCNFALPLEWCLQINGADELACDSLGLEDCVFGLMIEKNKYPIYYDQRMKMIEDRTPEHSVSEIRRTDKGKSPYDKSHGILKRTKDKLCATHGLNLRALRESIQRGEPFPIPTEPSKDWWDGQQLSEFP